MQCEQKSSQAATFLFLLQLFEKKVDSTLESGINVAPGKFGKKNKHSPIYTLYLYYSNRLYEVRNKAVDPGKKSKN